MLDRQIEQRPPRGGEDDNAPFFVLCTSRLMLKRGSLPAWAPKNIIKNTESWVLEDSEVDLSPADSRAPRVMSIWTRNLDHTTVLAITEGLRYTERYSDDGSMPAAITQSDTRADIRSDLPFSLLRGRIEKFGMKRYISHIDSSRNGLIWSIHQLMPSIVRKTELPALEESVKNTRRHRLLHAIRPPFLDGYPLGPWQWAKRKWRQFRESWGRRVDPTAM